jgi:hypothetical protein
MPLFLKLLRYYLWIAPHLLQIGIAGVMFRRQFVRLFPWFFAYTCYEVAGFAFLFSSEIFKFNAGYASFYSITAVVSTVLRFGVILEILRHLASKYVVLDRVLKPLFRWITSGLLIAALALALYAEGNRTNHWWFVVSMLDRTAFILQTGILAGLFLFSRYLTLSWRNHVFGIALGLGIYATVTLTTSAISAQAGYWHAELLDNISMAAYQCSTFVWLFYLLRRETIRTDDVHNLPTHHEVEVWNEELDRLLHQR